MQMHLKITGKWHFLSSTVRQKVIILLSPTLPPPIFCHQCLKLLSPTLPKLMNWILLSLSPLSSDPDTSQNFEHALGEGRLKDAGTIQKDLQLHDFNITSYYTDKYVLWLDFRTIDDNKLHELGRRLENTSEGIRLQITKKA